MGRPKKILIYNSGPLFPSTGMSQVRVINQVKALARDHKVSFYFLGSKRKANEQTIKELQSFCNEIRAINSFTRTIFYRVLKRLFLDWLFKQLAYPEDYFQLSNKITGKHIARIINRTQFDVIISHYWQASGFLKYLNNGAIKAVDTHYLVEENIELFNEGHYNHIKDNKLGSLLGKEQHLQNIVFSESDLLIVNSIYQKKILDTNNRQVEVICIPNGQDLEHFFNYSIKDNKSGSNFLFYGALSNQFNEKALKRLIEFIFPLIKSRVPEARLYVMGSNPPAWLMEKASGDNSIHITGYIEDVRTVFHYCCACIIPLESGSGFRGRVVELLAGGVPVIGTTNALKSIQIEQGVNGYICDSDEEIAQYAVLMATNHGKRLEIARNGKEFAKKNYSVEATFRRLSEYIYSI